MNNPPVAGGYRFSLFLDGDGNAWGCGRNTYGALGVGDTENKEIPSKIIIPQKIVMISAGQAHSLFLDYEGYSWSCGWNEYGQLGLGDTNMRVRPERIELPNISEIKALYNHSIFLDHAGLVWVCGNNGAYQLGCEDWPVHTPRLIENLPKIKTCAGGQYHSFFLDVEGSVWGCGGNLCGQLGLGCESKKISQPTRVENIPAIVSINSGQNHSFFIDKEGQVWGCGGNSRGQLTFKASDKVFNTLTKLEFPNAIQSIVAGSQFSIILDDGGNIWICGECNGDITLQRLGNAPPLIRFIAAGEDHGLFVTEKERVFSIGCHEYGQLGIRQKKKKNFPSFNKIKTLPLISAPQLCIDTPKSARNTA